jgi:general secretion pathway protein G
MDMDAIASPSRRRPRSSAARGFTLIEVLLVIVIIGMLATVLVFTVGGSQEGAKEDLTAANIKKIEGYIQRYYNDVGHYPSEAEGKLNALLTKPTFDDETTKWRGPYAKAEELKDSWGRDLVYEPVDTAADASAVPFKLFSAGRDGQPNTSDDIPKRTEGN